MMVDRCGQLPADLSGVSMLRPARERRARPRLDAEWPVQLQCAQGLNVPCTLVDISQAGCQLIFETSVLIEIGRVHCIKLEDAQMVAAYAVWRRERLAGFRFTTRLCAPLVEHIAGAIPHSAGLACALGTSASSGFCSSDLQS